MKRILSIIFCAVLFSGAGYKGSLPKIEPQFEYLKTTPAVTQQLFTPADELDSPVKLTPSPRNHPTYIDIILKKDKTSPCIEKQGDVQKFNAIASSIIDHADYLTEKYADKPERFYISFKKLQELSAQARAVATLRCEAQIYLKYLTYQNEGQVYSKENIQKQVEYFSHELKATLQLLRDAN